ncbi:MAG: B12-binding domain-containing radical SAM protein [Deltaproteobacteria bacterium]|nr:B12-binding domain-containing radical SAM protein [Deltaproteobacteria bacterium]
MKACSVSPSNRVLLVYPGSFTNLFPEIPLPLLYLGWALGREGYDVEVLDARIQDYRKVDFSRYLLVGVSTMTGSMIRDAIKIAARARTHCPDVPLVWGGIHPSLLPEQTLSHPLVDIVVRGEGEMTLVELANSLRDGTGLEKVKGIVFMREGRTFTTEPRDFIDLNRIDIELPYHLLKMDRYKYVGFPVHTSRGCPYRCGFCYNTSFHRRQWRSKSAERVLDEVSYVIRRFGTREICFGWEDEFFISLKRIRLLCEGLLRRGLKIRWWSFCRFDNFARIDDDLLGLMERSGCWSLSFGGESGSQRILDEVIHKDIKLEQVLRATERLAKTQIRQIVSFMSGLPGETREDLRKTFQLIDRLSNINRNVYFNGIVMYTPYPGTPLFSRISKQFGYQMPGSLDAWGNFEIFRDPGNIWHSGPYVRMCKTISLLTRFPFWYDGFKLKDVKDVIGGGRLKRPPFNVIYFLFARIARFRWKKRLFHFPLEWKILEWVLKRVRGYV